MTRPRRVLAGEFYLVTRRCAQRQFLLRPDADTNQAFIYCLAVAAQRFEIDVLLPVAESNHHHTVIFDRHGRYPLFVQHFHKLLARCMNAYRGRWENFWSSEQASVVRLVNRTDVIEKLAYAAANPVKDFLVEKIHQWPGINGYLNLRRDVPYSARRPRFFFRKAGALPDQVTLQLVIPRELGDRAELLEALARRVKEYVEAAAATRAKTGRHVVGRKRVQTMSWRAHPSSDEPRRDLRPEYAVKNEDDRRQVLREHKAFLLAYREARILWLAGFTVTFPEGTFWLLRYARVSAPLPP